MRSEDESTEGATSDHHENAFPVENEQLNREDGIVEREDHDRRYSPLDTVSK